MITPPASRGGGLSQLAESGVERQAHHVAISARIRLADEECALPVREGRSGVAKIERCRLIREAEPCEPLRDEWRLFACTNCNRIRTVRPDSGAQSSATCNSTLQRKGCRPGADCANSSNSMTCEKVGRLSLPHDHSAFWRACPDKDGRQRFDVGFSSMSCPCRFTKALALLASIANAHGSCTSSRT